MDQSKSDALNVEAAKEIIRKQGKTRTWIANKCGITRGYLNQILCGDRLPSRRVLILLASALETTVEALAKGATKAKAS